MVVVVVEMGLELDLEPTRGCAIRAKAAVPCVEGGGGATKLAR